VIWHIVAKNLILGMLIDYNREFMYILLRGGLKSGGGSLQKFDGVHSRSFAEDLLVLSTLVVVGGLQTQPAQQLTTACEKHGPV